MDMQRAVDLAAPAEQAAERQLDVDGIGVGLDRAAEDLDRAIRLSSSR